jgi:D-sedoheptulose 7-phosphate isomerase
MHRNEFACWIRRTVESSIAVKQQLLADAELVGTIAAVSELLIEAIRKDNKPILFGNGGSAADAQHIAAEFVGRFAFDRPPLPALALTVNPSCVTAIGNDYGYDLVFVRQLEALGRPGDVAIGISTSGNSPSVIEALTTARRLGLHTVALTGASGGKVKGVPVDYCLCAPSTETARVQECHILIGHVISELVEQGIFSGQTCISEAV